MAVIAPFCGIFYNRRKAGSFKKVLSGPLDFFLGKTKELDTSYSYQVNNLIYSKKNSKMSSIEHWLDSGVLMADKTPAFYITEENFMFRKKNYKRLGLYAMVKCDDSLIPHEDVRPGKIKQFIHILKREKAHLSPIFGLYEDNGTISSLLHVVSRKLPPFMKFDFPERSFSKRYMHYKVWRITNLKIIRKIIKQIKQKRIYIADGHHRYEATVEMARIKGKEGFVLAGLFSTKESGVLILPIHRVVKFLNVKKEALLENLKQRFLLNPVKIKSPIEFIEKITKKKSLGMYTKGDGYYILSALDSGHSNLRIVLEHIHELIDGFKLEYAVNEHDIVKSIDKNEFTHAFFILPTTFSQIKETILKKERLPAKTTYFFPKLLSGLVMGRLMPCIS